MAASNFYIDWLFSLVSLIFETPVTATTNFFPEKLAVVQILYAVAKFNFSRV